MFLLINDLASGSCWYHHQCIENAISWAECITLSNINMYSFHVKKNNHVVYTAVRVISGATC